MAPSEQNAGKRALRLAKAAALQAGFDISGAKTVRVRSSVHVELPSAGILARVEAPGDEKSAKRQVLVARALAERDAPVARLACPELQPFLVEDGAVTLWWRLEAVAEPNSHALGRAVRTLHEATRGSLDSKLPMIDPCRDVHSLLDWPSPWSGSEESEELRRRARELEERWQSGTADDPLGRVVVHGDVHRENAIATDQGLVLVDLEDASVGSASWDFAPLSVGVKRYGVAPREYRDFVIGYGDDPGVWEGFNYMCSVYELMSVAWAMRCSESSPQMAEEASVRVAGLLDGSRVSWTLL